MIENLSPVTRRIVAVGLLVLLLLLAVQLIVVPLFQALGDARAELAELRARRARLHATTTRLLPDASTLPPALAVSATDQAAADRQLKALLSGAARIASVTLDAIAAQPPAPGASHDVAAQIAASGTEAGLTNFASLVEHGTPAIRFRQWRLVAGDTPNAPMHLTGLAVAAWMPLP